MKPLTTNNMHYINNYQLYPDLGKRQYFINLISLWSFLDFLAFLLYQKLFLLVPLHN